jgi:hypothetical protein
LKILDIFESVSVDLKKGNEDERNQKRKKIEPTTNFVAELKPLFVTREVNHN